MCVCDDFFFVLRLCFSPQDYLTLDRSHLSLAGQQRQHVWNVVETDTGATPPRSLIPRSFQMADGVLFELFFLLIFMVNVGEYTIHGSFG